MEGEVCRGKGGRRFSLLLYIFNFLLFIILLTSLILPILTYAVEVWGCAYYHKYLSRIDRLFKRVFKLGYCKERFFIENVIALKDEKFWDKITDSDLKTALDNLLPPKRTMVTLRKRRHNYITPSCQN